MKPLFFAKEEKIIVSNRKSLFFSKDEKNKVKQSKRMLSEESGCPVCLSLHAGNFLSAQIKIASFIGITELRAVQEQLRDIENLKVEFAKRFYTHLDKFISQHVSDWF